ncbi:hypothetical protein ZEAMMB73_Zm00001d007064 [Zea mays]|uniref:Uncharacterized protein n=1 Tax=Zea mays TaxID=4577 RepID=A0A1D6F2M1_MAIZE|nr:hypothetical protein ZEAMMB73_Zm00001d007064 [Zea mays]
MSMNLRWLAGVHGVVTDCMLVVDETGGIFEKDDEGMPIRGTGGVRNIQPNGDLLAITPSIYVTVLQKIGRLRDSRVEFRSTVSSGKSRLFPVEVLFNNENGIGIEKTRDEAQAQDAEKTLQNLKSEYISSTSCVHHAL